MMITKITYHTLHVDQGDRFTQHHFVKWTNKKRCEVENIMRSENNHKLNK